MAFIHNGEVDSPGKRLRQLRKSLGLKLREVAEASGVPVSTISDLENERSENPSGVNLTQLSAFYEVEPHWIVTGDGPKHIVASKGDKETELLLYYRALSHEGQQYLIARARSMLNDEHHPPAGPPALPPPHDGDKPIQ